MSIDPSTARRQFKRHYGMTFQAYHRARRLGLALQEVRRWRTGGGSTKRQRLSIRQRFSRRFRPDFRRFAECGEVAGRFVCGAHRNAIGRNAGDCRRQRVAFAGVHGSAGDEDGIRRFCANGSGRMSFPENIAIWTPFAPSWPIIFPGRIWSLPCRWRRLARSSNCEPGRFCNRFRWAKPDRIPGWRNVSVTKRRAAPSAGPTVTNMMCIVIPCHRVIRADGTLCGYGGGLWRKKWLLDHEQRVVRANVGGASGRDR